MRKLKFILLAIVVTFTSAGGLEPYRNPTSDWIPIGAEKIIQDCWAISLEDRSSGSTDRQRAGHLDTALCLEDQVIKHASVFHDTPEFTQSALKERFTQLNKIYGRFYWDIYNDHKGCRRSCGTIFQSFHNAELAKLYENMLRDVIAQRNRYGF